MKALCVFALCVAAATPALAVDSDPISPTQATGRQGSNVLVEGRASVRPATAGRDGVDIALRSGDNSAVIIAYVLKGDLQRFPDVGQLDGRVIDVQGVVEMASGQAEIHLTSPDQLAIAR